MQRADPTQRTTAPTHGFRPWEGSDRVFQYLCDNLSRGATLLFDAREIDRAFGRVAFL